MHAFCIIVQLALCAWSVRNTAASEPPPQPDLELTSRVDEVMLSASGATLTRLVDVELPEGITPLRIILGDVANADFNADWSDAVTVVASGADMLHHTIREVSAPPDERRLEALRLELKRISEKAQIAEERILGATADIELLESVARTIAETRVELDSEALLELIESINARRRVITEDLARQKRVLDESMSEQARLEEEHTSAERGSRQMLCEIITRSSGGPARFTITRKDSESRWNSEVEVDWRPGKDSVRIRLLGRIENRSAVDWSEVRLSLDTDLDEGARPLEPLQTSVIEIREDDDEVGRIGDSAEAEASDGDASTLGTRTRSFTVELPITLRKDEIGLVLLESFETAFATSLIARPVMTDGVHLEGVTRNTSNGFIPAGPLRVIRDGRPFIGDENRIIEERSDFQIPLGIREDIVLTRRLISREEVRTGLLNGGRLTTLEYRITLRNLGERACIITVEDRIPISKTEDIEVSLKSSEPQPIIPPDSKGTMQWLIELPAGGPESEPVDIVWAVTIAHSADEEINDFIE